MNFFNAHLHLTETISTRCSGIYNATDESQWDRIITLYDASHRIFPAIGIHPWFTQSASAYWEQKMEHTLSTHPFVQVGEIGLDGLRPDINKQEELFVRQFMLAQKYHRITSIHAVRTLEKIRLLIQKLNFSAPVILHDYHATGNLTQKFHNLNVYFSVGRHFSIPHIADIPFNRLLIETDTQDPADLTSFATKVAASLGITVQQLEHQISVNVKELFHDI